MIQHTLVSLDLETTGLDPKKDRIIEIGAVKFTGEKSLDTWSTLVNPGRRIPPQISKLTGITDAMVRGQPPIEEVLQKFSGFVGQAPVLGHNVQFDLGFLRQQGVLTKNPSLDTYEIASILLPSAGRYNLRALGQRLDLPFQASHRALDDSQVTREVFLDLYEKILDLPLPILAEIVRLSAKISWDGKLPFLWAYQERNGAGLKSTYQNPLLSISPPEETSSLHPRESHQPLDLPEVAALLEPGGAFFKEFPDYEHRPEQVQMLRETARAISEGRHFLIEAGTGIGKSLAYLVPAAIWATKNRRRVVISTNTINLQDQLMAKDIPALKSVLDLELKAAVLKGRSNYLCPHHLEMLRKSGPKNADELRVVSKILVWLNSSLTGDRGEINLNGPRENQIWNRLSAEHEDCSSEGCLKRTGGRCPFFQARQRAHAAHLLVVNHALLLADMSTGNRVLPEYDTLIIDEAHHIESATTNALSFYTSQSNFRRSLNALGDQKNGALKWVLQLGEKTLSPGELGSLHSLAQTMVSRSFKVNSRMDKFFSSLSTFMDRKRGGKPVGRYSQQERILTETRTQPNWVEIEIAWDEARQPLHGLILDIQNLWENMQKILSSAPEQEAQIETLLNDLREISRSLYEIFENIDNLVFQPDPNMIYWLESSPHYHALTIQAAPLHIGELMERYIWYEKRAVILTSATLTTTGSFEYIRSRLKAIDAEELALGSPFDYQQAALLYLVDDIPEPTDYRGHQRALNLGLIELCKATGGRALVLFTSYSQLQATAKAITGPLAEKGIIVYEQGSGPSPHTLLTSFREADQAVLLGTRAFWEGVDVPGQDLSVLVIAKLPFDVPSDPIIASRSDAYHDPFQEFFLPEAILSFRQGFGRLIRTKQDTGVVVIMDRRLDTKSYKDMFLSSLPPCTKQKGPLSELAETARRWLNI